MGMVRIRLGRKDQLLKKWYKAMRDRGDNASEATVLIIRYYIRTGQYMNAACLKPDMEDINDCFKSAFIPDHSDVEEWLLEKAEEGIKKSAMVKRILRSSMRECTEQNTPFILDTDKLFQMVEHPDNVQSVVLKRTEYEKETPSHKPETVQSKQKEEIVESREASGIVRSIEPVIAVSEEDEKANSPSLEPKITTEQKPRKRSNTLFNNLVTTGLKH